MTTQIITRAQGEDNTTVTLNGNYIYSLFDTTGSDATWNVSINCNGFSGAISDVDAPHISIGVIGTSNMNMFNFNCASYTGDLQVQTAMLISQTANFVGTVTVTGTNSIFAAMNTSVSNLVSNNSSVQGVNLTVDNLTLNSSRVNSVTVNANATSVSDSLSMTSASLTSTSLLLNSVSSLNLTDSSLVSANVSNN